MARTLDPNKELEDFKTRITQSHGRYERLYAAVASVTDATTLRKGLAVDACFRLGSEWELFQHRWHIAAISRDSTKLIEIAQTQIQSAKQSIADSTLDLFNVDVRYVSPGRLTGEQIEKIIDPKDRNVTFTDTRAWVNAATKQLTSPYIAKINRITTNNEDACILELLKAVRNAIAHGSRDSKARLNASLKLRVPPSEDGLVGSVNTGFVRPDRGVRDIGTYLNGAVGYPPQTRITVLTKRVEEIAHKLKM